MANIQKIKVGNSTYSIALPYGTCSTAAGTKTKSVSISGYPTSGYVAGDQIIVYFENGNTNSAPQLSINSGTGLNVFAYTNAGLSATTWRAGAIIHFTFNGTGWVINSVGAFNASTVSVSDTSLSVSPSVTPTANASATGNISLTAQSSQPSSGYYIKATGGNSATTGSAKSGESSIVTWTNGYIDASTSSTQKTVSSTATATANASSTDKYYSIPTGGCTVTGGGLSQGTASGGGLSGGGLSGGGLTKGAGSVSVTPTNVILTEVAEAPSSGYYITATGSGTVDRAAVTRAKITRAAFSQTVNRAAITDTHTEGYIPAKSATTVISAGSSTVSLAEGSIAADSTTIGATSLASNTATKYYTVKSGVLSNSASSGVTYSELSSPSLNEQDYLYINAGWYPNSKISLSTLIPDDPDYDNAGNSHILKNYEAYDTTGKKLLGTIENVSWNTNYYTTTDTGYGGISNALYTGGSTHYIKAGSVSSSVSGTNPSATGKLTVSGTKANYGFTTTKPSGTDGTNYLTLTPGATAGSAQTFTANMSLTAGWVAAKGTEGTKSVSASVSDGTLEYIPIVTPAFDGGGLTGDDISGTQTKGSVTIAEDGTFFNSTGYGITTTKPSGTDGTNYLTVHESHSTDSGSVTGSTTITRAAVLYNGAKKGLISIADDTQALASDTKKVSASITVTPSVTDNFEPYYVPISAATATAGTATAEASIAKDPSASASATQSGMDDGVSSTATSYYFTSSASAASGYSTASASATGGSASVSAGITKGASASGQDSGDKSATSTEKTASDSSTVYLKEAAIGAEADISGSGQTTLSYGKQRTIAAGYTPGFTIKNSVGAGTIKNNTSGGTSSGTINCGSQIKIGAGYYAADKYYTAQTSAAGASGNIQCNASSSNNVAGYATASVRSASTFTMAGSAVTDAVTVGTLLSGYYPISAKVKGTIAAGTAGWFSTSGAVQATTATQVGKIAASSVTRSGNTLSWNTGYIPADSTEGVITVSNATTLNNNLVEANAGIYYKYTGSTTTVSGKTYINGNIYTYES